MTTANLGTMVTNLRLETGHSSLSTTGLNQRDQLVYVLNRVQEELVLDYDFPGFVVDRDIALVANQRYYSYAADLPFDNIDHVILRDGTPSGFYRLAYGIGPAQLAEFDSDASPTPATSWPVSHWMHHYDTQKFELWPIPNQAPTGAVIRQRGTVQPPVMVNDADLCILPATAVLLFAAAEVLAREGSKDAALKLEKAKAYMRRLRVRQSAHKSRPFVLGGGHHARRGRPGLDYIPEGYGSGPLRERDAFSGGEFGGDFLT